MNYKTTKKAVMNGYSNVIYTGYCDLQHLLNYESVSAHTERAEGWGADIYHISANTCIVTGYAPFGNIHPSYDIVKKYDDTAAEIIMRRDNNANAKEDCEHLIDAFIAEVTA